MLELCMFRAVICILNYYKKALIRNKVRREKMSVDGFNFDNVFIRILNRLGDAIILSLTFVVCCLPLFTIGSAITALYYTTMKSITIEDGYVFKFFIKSFKENLKQSTIIWIISLVALDILSLNVWFWYSQWKQNGSEAMQMIMVLSVVAIIVALMVIMYVFPLQAKFENSVKVQFKNAFLLSVKNFPITILLFAIMAIIVWFFYYMSVVFVVIGFGLMGYLYGYFMSKCFEPYLKQEEATKETTAEDTKMVADEGKSETDKEEEIDKEIKDEKETETDKETENDKEEETKKEEEDERKVETEKKVDAEKEAEI